MGERFNTLTRVYPSQDPNIRQVDDGWRVMRHFFLNITKGKRELTQYSFVKVFRKSKFLHQQCGIREADLVILYQKANGNRQLLYFFPFFNLMLLLKNKCQ